MECRGYIRRRKVPNVSNPKSYFVRFNWSAGIPPEWGNNFKGNKNVY
jgi:hypothetical protein